MFAWIVRKSLQSRGLVLFAAMALIIYGAFLFTRTPVDVLPDLTRPTVTIMAETAGLAPEEVEKLVTRPIENVLRGVAGVTTVRSTSGSGYAIVNAEFGWNETPDVARLRVSERIPALQGALPGGVTPIIAPATSIMGEILLVALTSQNADWDGMKLRETADFDLRPQLLAIPGVASVSVIGGNVRQFGVAPSVVALAEYGLTLDHVVAALKRFSANNSGGFIDSAGQEHILRLIGHSMDLTDLRNLPVGEHQGATVFLHQVARVDFSTRTRRGDAGFNGHPAVIVSVAKQPAADTLVLTDDIEKLLSEVQKTAPEGVRLDQIQFRQADFINVSIENLQFVVLKAAIVVAIVLVVFLRSARASIISLAALPTSLVLSVVIFHFMGLSINTMTLGGIAIAVGELVDDAVVDVENVIQKLKRNIASATPRPTLDVIVEASQEVRSGIVYATLIVVVVFVPLLFMPGLEGRMFHPLALAYIVSILASLVVSVTLTPVLCHWFLPQKAADFAKSGDGFLVRRLKAGARALIVVALRRSRAVIAAAVLVVAVGVAGILSMPRTFLPSFNEGTILVGLRLAPGSSLEAANQIGQLAERLILQVPDVASVGRRTGRAEGDLHAEGVHAAEIDVRLKPDHRPMAVVMEEIRAQLARAPADAVLGQPISHRIEHMLSGVRAAVAVKLYGPDLEMLEATAESLRARLAMIPGLTDVQVERQAASPQISVAVKPEVARRLGVRTQAVLEQVQTLMSGKDVARVFDGERTFNVTVKARDEERTLAKLRKLPVQTPQGVMPLEALAEVHVGVGPGVIYRENGVRRSIVFGNLSGERSLADVSAAIARELDNTTLPQGYRLAMDGAQQASARGLQLMLVMSLASLLAIVAILYRKYQAGVLVAIIMFNIPLSFVGGVVALRLAGLDLSIASAVGFIALAGICTRNSILKISHYLNMIATDGYRMGPGVVVRGSLDRLTPVLLTACSAALALVPLIMLKGAPGAEILHPVAVTMFGGLISATLLDTIVTPVLFHSLAQKAVSRLTVSHLVATDRAQQADHASLY
ncbi:multidrug transporter AcrB [Camelimonas fluminis]|uniref:Efflux RND transporter permease subunit n=1 Tax=Camelimonas fluminis TaxID=1576911 RepID=A0ABV7UC27_9HYPH|nr:efflux RND transporter permease subunit [Camelimonas fluminis]GHE73582.1 multidrug transporter AcrB [Camelimonas fluminis]